MTMTKWSKINIGLALIGLLLFGWALAVSAHLYWSYQAEKRISDRYIFIDLASDRLSSGQALRKAEAVLAAEGFDIRQWEPLTYRDTPPPSAYFARSDEDPNCGKFTFSHTNAHRALNVEVCLAQDRIVCQIFEHK